MRKLFFIGEEFAKLIHMASGRTLYWEVGQLLHIAGHLQGNCKPRWQDQGSVTTDFCDSAIMRGFDLMA